MGAEEPCSGHGDFGKTPTSPDVDAVVSLAEELGELTGERRRVLDDLKNLEERMAFIRCKIGMAVNGAYPGWRSFSFNEFKKARDNGQ